MKQKKNDFPGAHKVPMSKEQEGKIYATARKLGVENPIFEFEGEFISKVDATSMIHPFDDILLHKRLTTKQYRADLRYCQTQEKVVHMDDVIRPGDEAPDDVSSLTEEPSPSSNDTNGFQGTPYRFKFNAVEEAIAGNAIPGEIFNSKDVYDWLPEEHSIKWYEVFGSDEKAALDVSDTVGGVARNLLAGTSDFPLERCDGHNQRYIYHPDGVPEPVIVPEPTIVQSPIPEGYKRIGMDDKGHSLYMLNGKVGRLEFIEIE